MSPALADGFLTTGPPGKSQEEYFKDVGQKVQIGKKKSEVLFLMSLVQPDDG